MRILNLYDLFLFIDLQAVVLFSITSVHAEHKIRLFSMNRGILYIYLFSFSFTYLRKINKKENRIMKEKEKRTVYIDGLMMGEGVGHSAQICVDGVWYRTSPVEGAFCAPGCVQIETKNTFYVSKPVYEVEQLADLGNTFWVRPEGSVCGITFPYGSCVEIRDAYGNLMELRFSDRIFRLKARRFA